MRIGLDLTALTAQHTGVDRFLWSLAEHLPRVAPPDWRLHVFANREDLPALRFLPGNVRLHGVCWRPRPARLLFQQTLLPLASLAQRLDVLHSPSFIMPLWRAGRRHVLTIHDLTMITMPEVHIALRRSEPFARAVTHSIRRADVVHVPSNFVKRVIEQRIPDVDPARIRVISHGIASHFTPRAAERADAVAQQLGIPRPYILYVGNIDPRKNLPQLLRAYAERLAGGRAPEHLVIAGPLGWGYEEVLHLCRAPELRGRVHLPGYVAERDLPALIAGARLFVYPSREEGFGFPPLEAMACGVPVIATQSSSLAENLHGAASLVPVDDPRALGAEMDRLLGDEALRAQRRALGLACAARFSWQDTATQMLAAYRDAAERRP